MASDSVISKVASLGGATATWFGVLLAALVWTGAQPGAAHASAPAAGVAMARPYADYLYVTAFPLDPAQVQTIWRIAEYVLAPHDPRLEPHQLAVTGPAIAALRDRGIALQIEPLDVQALVDDSYRQRPRAHAAAAGLFGSWFSTVQPLDAIYAYLDELVQTSGGRATVQTIGKTIQGRDIKAVRFSTAPAGVERPSIFVSATQHAREWAVPMVVMGLVDGLVRQYDADPQVRSVLDVLDVYVIPVVNADGYVASHAGQRLQRKNMNPKCNVDLNRNWDAWWGNGVPVNGCDEETYPGLAVFSEPETQAVKTFAEARKAVRLCFDYHSAASQVGYPFAYTTMKPADLATDQAWAELYSKTLAAVHGASLPAKGDYGIGAGEGGSAIDWYRLKFPHSIEIELRSGGSLGGFGISDDLVIPFVEENWAGWLAVAVEVAKQNQTGHPAADAAAPESVDARSLDASADHPAAHAPDATSPAGSGRVDAAVIPGGHDTDGTSGCDCNAGRSRAPNGATLVVAAWLALAGIARIRRRRIS